MSQGELLSPNVSYLLIVVTPHLISSIVMCRILKHKTTLHRVKSIYRSLIVVLCDVVYT